jgi:transcriptional regulator CtsR
MTLSDAIETHLRDLLAYQGEVELKRSDLSDYFACAPSQINYVLTTRFSVERGYQVESRRGEGGYIRLRRLNCPDLPELLESLVRFEGQLGQAEAEALIGRLEEGGLLAGRVARMLRRAVDRRVLAVPLPERDLLRYRLLTEMLAAYLATVGGERR